MSETFNLGCIATACKHPCKHPPTMRWVATDFVLVLPAGTCLSFAVRINMPFTSPPHHSPHPLPTRPQSHTHTHSPNSDMLLRWAQQNMGPDDELHVKCIVLFPTHLLSDTAG